MTEETTGVPAEARWLLDTCVHTFEHLEALVLLHREPCRDFTAQEVARILETGSDLGGVLEQLAGARLIVRREHSSTPPTYGYGPSTSELSTALQSLLSTYERSRPAVIRLLNSNVIARVRSGAARLFAESFVIRRGMRAAQTPDARRPVALFLDVDGTLVDLAPRPEDVVVSPRILQLLTRLHVALGGALALVSGRNLQQLDELFAPLKLPCAGMHGSERRDCNGQLHYTAPSSSRLLEPARAALQAFVARHPGLLLEDKGASLALHFRGRPELAEEAERQVKEAHKLLGEDFRIQSGVLVRELVPRTASKGRAVEAFLAEPAFAGRVPIFIGDDLTDLDGFAAVERHGGRGIAVGNRISAASRLPQPSAVHDWLEFLLRAGGRYAV